MSNTPLGRFLSTSEEKIKHAYLLVCPKEGELKAAVSGFLRKLYCGEGKACGVCEKCRKVINGNHPDILTVRTDEAAIKVNDVRAALPFIAEKAYEGVYKAVVVENAEKLTPEAQNCLLKSIEEPPANTVFILCARMENTLLSTISSRCEVVRIRPLPFEEAVRTVKGRTAETELKVRLACHLADGYVLEAERLMADAEYFALREQAIALCEKLCTAKNMGIQKHADFLEEKKERFSDILQVMQSYFFDLQLYKQAGEAAEIRNIDRKKQIAEYAYNFTRSGLSTIIDLLCETEKRLKFALNFRLAVESMLIGILEVKHTW
jgi:DNA polymerase-3 subunit delta'